VKASAKEPANAAGSFVFVKQYAKEFSKVLLLHESSEKRY
jgi:hypothetical protein